MSNENGIYLNQKNIISKVKRSIDRKRSSFGRYSMVRRMKYKKRFDLNISHFVWQLSDLSFFYHCKVWIVLWSQIQCDDCQTGKGSRKKRKCIFMAVFMPLARYQFIRVELKSSRCWSLPAINFVRWRQSAAPFKMKRISFFWEKNVLIIVSVYQCQY